MSSIKILTQNDGLQSAGNVQEMIGRVSKLHKFDKVSVAVAYASVAGLRAFVSALDGTNALSESHWLFGLDDCLTHPSVLEVAADIPKATVRVAGERFNNRRFHSKVIFFSAQSDAQRASILVGSSNLTRGGLSSNVETVVSAESGDKNEIKAFQDVWNGIWSVGNKLDNELLRSYQKDFDKCQAFRKAFRKENKKEAVGEILEKDSASIDPSCASVCWIEVGKITGFLSEQLEIKAEQALFFGLENINLSANQIAVKLKKGTTVVIPVKYRGNAMWRFNLPQTIPEVAKGLRPRGNRSPYVAVFERLAKDILTLSFIDIKSTEFKAIRIKSEIAGTLGKTSAREYGWY